MSTTRRHIPYLSFHKNIIRSLCRPQKDDLLIIAKGLGLRRIICALLKTYDRTEDLVVVINARPEDEAGIGDELGIMGVREPGLRILTHEMTIKDREEMYRRGGLFSITSRILVYDLMKNTIPADLITGLVVLHAESVKQGSLEEFAVRLYRRKNQSGFCKAFSDEPERFAQGLSPLKDMLINLNMNNVMLYPRFNEDVRTALLTRQPEAIELYQPMTDLMRQCQDAIHECMEAMLVELKRDHSLNLDLEDLTVRNAQFKNFDTIVYMRLRPVWHKVGMKTKLYVQALAELRDLQTWLLEYDSTTFAAFISTLQRQHFRAQKKSQGPGQYLHDWFNVKSAAQLVHASQLRVSRPKVIIEGTASTLIPDGESHRESNTTTNGETAREEFAEEMEAVRELEDELDAPIGGEPIPEEDSDEVMREISTQVDYLDRTHPPTNSAGDQNGGANAADELYEMPSTQAPRALYSRIEIPFSLNVTPSVEKRMRKGHEPVLEEQPKWALLAKVLKEIEDTIARVSDSHSDQPGTNTVLVMAASDITCGQLKDYLTTMMPTDPPFGPQAGRKMMETLFLSNWQHEKNGRRLATGAHTQKVMKYVEKQRFKSAGMGGGRPPPNKRRRQRGGAAAQVSRISNAADRNEEFYNSLVNIAGDDGDGTEDAEIQWVLEESLQLNAGPSAGGQTAPSRATGAHEPSFTTDPTASLLATAGVLQADDLHPRFEPALTAWGMGEDWSTDFGLLPQEDAVIIRSYGGEDDDIMLQELRPRFIVMYEPNLAFIRRCEVYKNCNPGLPLRVYRMTYQDSVEEERSLAVMNREDEAFKRLVEDRGGLVIPIYNNNPRAPMRDSIVRPRTTYSTRNAGGGEDEKEDPQIIVDIRELGSLLPSLLDGHGVKVIPATLIVGDYILSPKMCVERKALPDLEQSLNNGRLHTQCEAMTAHYETCILLIEFDEDRFGIRSKDDARREAATRGGTVEDGGWMDYFRLQSRLVLLSLHFPRLRILWSSSPHESVKILSDLKLNHDEPDEMAAILKGSASEDRADTLGQQVENAAAVEMLRAIPGISGHNYRHVMANVESIRELVDMDKESLQRILGEKNGTKAYDFMHRNGLAAVD